MVRNAQITVMKNETACRRLTTCRLQTVSKIVVSVDICADVGVGEGAGMVLPD